MLKKIKNINKQKKGFSIGEVILAAFILSFGMVAVLNLFVRGIKELQDERDTVVASMLAQEGVELVRNIRDNNWAERNYSDIVNPSKKFTPKTFADFKEKSNCVVSYKDDEITDCNNGASVTASNIMKIGGGSFFLQKDSGTLTKFKRRINIDGDAPHIEDSDEVIVRSIVIWGGSSFPSVSDCTVSKKCVFSESILTNWGTGT